jgi:hypothetical protein
MVAEKQLDEFIRRIQQAAGENLRGVILYGSAAAGEFQSEFSHLNLLCLLRETSFSSIAAIAPVARWWQGKKHPAPLVMTREELERSADVFAVEMLDMQQHHRVLLGEEVLAGLRIPMHLHRAQVEYELREKLILLRQRLLEAAGREARLWDLLLNSVAAFATLFRHALVALGDATPRSKREAVQALAARIPFDPSAVLQLLDIREYKADRKQLNVKDVFTRYLAAVQQVVSAVDTMLETSGPGRV